MQNCHENPKNCSVAELCAKAKTGNDWDLRRYWKKFVNEAKSRGLTCGVSTKVSKAETCFSNPKNCTSLQLCDVGTYTQNGGKKWYGKSDFRGKHALEAKNKGFITALRYNLGKN